MNLRHVLLILLIALITSVALRCSLKILNTNASYVRETFIGDAIPLPHNPDTDLFGANSSTINSSKSNGDGKDDIRNRFQKRNIFNLTLTRRNEEKQPLKLKPKPTKSITPKSVMKCPNTPKPIDVNSINTAFESGLVEYEDQVDDLDEQIIKKMEMIETLNGQILVLQNQMRDQEIARQEAQNMQDKQDKMMLEVSGEQNRTLVKTYKDDLNKTYKEIKKLKGDNKKLQGDNDKLRQGVCVKQKKKKKKI